MPPETPLFTVVMPAYNAQAYVRQAVDSVIAQTLGDWELIVVDDQSTDATAFIVATMAQSEPRIRLLHGAHSGPSAARNLALAGARGRYVAFLDADDAWLPDKLARHAAHFASCPEVVLSFTRARFMSPQGRPTRTVSTAPTSGLRVEHFLYDNPTTSPSTMAVRRSARAAAVRFDPAMSAAEDLDWIVRLLLATGGRAEGIDAPLALYRTSPGGLSSSLDRMLAGWEQLLENVREIAPELHARHYRAARASNLRYLARRALRLGDDGKAACGYLREAFRSDWRLVLRSPRRTLLTLAAALGRRALLRLTASLGRLAARQG